VPFCALRPTPRAFERPLEPAVAWQRVNDWLAAPAAWIPGPGSGRVQALGELVLRYEARGNLVPDAMLAALALEHGLTIIRPGIAKYELLAVLSDGILRRHGEVVFTRLVASGRNTNPCGSEAHGKLVMPGDVVGVDADACGYEGYVIDVSRTFCCGERPTDEQIELYRVAHECVTGMREVARVGMSYREFAELAPSCHSASRPQCYDIMVHGAGLEDEGPTIYYPRPGR